MSEYQRDERLQRLFEVGQEIYASDIAEAIPAIESLERRLQEAEKEGLEQARLLGMSGEREADLRGKLQRAEQKIEQLESEAAVKDYALNDVLHRIETENLHWGEIDTIKDALSVGTASRELLERLEKQGIVIQNQKAVLIGLGVKTGDGSGKVWCAWCGKWGDHQSGWCPDLKAKKTEKNLPARESQQSHPSI